MNSRPMKESKINREYMDLVRDNKDEFKKDYKDTIKKVENSTAVYKGKPVPFLYHPMFYTKEDLKDFKKIGDMMTSIANKVTDHYIEDEGYRKKFGYPKLIEELIQVDNGYDIHVPIGRFDIFYKDMENFKFCELNTDGSSAMNEDNELSKILLQTKAVEKLKKKHKIDYFELFYSWVDEAIKIYNKFDSSNKNPNVAIVDFKESATPKEFERFKDAFTARGYNCIIVDPRELEYRDGALYRKDYKIDLVYRRIVTFELIKKADEINDFLDAYRDRAFCCIGSIRSQVIHNKIFFQVVHEKESLDLLNDEEKEFVKKHIPHTGVFGGNDETFDHILNHKDRYIMKPMDLNASYGVYVGRDLSQEKWEEKLKESWNNEYLYQEFIEPYKRDFLVFEDGEFQTQSLNTIIGLYMYNEDVHGIYTRIGPNNIISGLTDYYVLPSLYVE